MLTKMLIINPCYHRMLLETKPSSPRHFYNCISSMRIIISRGYPIQNLGSRDSRSFFYCRYFRCGVLTSWLLITINIGALRKCCSPRPGLIELQISSAVQIARKLLKKGHPGVNDGFNFMVFDWSFLMTFNWIMVELLCFGPIKTSSRPKTVTPGYRLFICIILGVLIF